MAPMDDFQTPPRYPVPAAEGLMPFSVDAQANEESLFGLENAKTADAFNEALREAFRKLDQQRRTNGLPAQ